VHRLRGEGRQPALSGFKRFARTSFGTPGHLAGRFFASLRPGGPEPAGEAWARNWLTQAETEIWAGMSGPDRRHAVEVARRVATASGNGDGAGVARNLLAAALLHDAGKQRSALGVFGRTATTVAAILVGRDRIASWAKGRSGWPARAGRYVTHDELGEEMLRKAGSDPLVFGWASDHHRPVASWTVDPGFGQILKAADDDQ